MLDLVRSGIAKPAEVPRFMGRRVRDLVSDRPRFDVGTVTGASSHPELAREIYADVRHFHSIVEDYRAMRSLEVGCGFGKMTPWIAECSERHFAIDQEPDLVEVTRSLYPSVTVETAVASDLPYPANHFDLTVTWGVLMHVPPENVGDVVAEIERVTAPEGVVVISERTGGVAKRKRSWIRPVSFYETLFDGREVVDRSVREPEAFRREGHEDVALRFEAE